MPDYHIGDILSACDLCHSRKIKCDRQAVCANCVDAGAECKRVRRSRPKRKRNSESDMAPQETLMAPDGNSFMTQRYHWSPETAIREGSAPSTTALSGDKLRDKVPTPLGNCFTPTALSTRSDDGSNYHAIQARKIIEIDMRNPSISFERQSLLTFALEQVNRIANSSPRHDDIAVEEQSHPQNDTLAIPDTPSRELLFLLLPGPAGSVRAQWPDHISSKAYSRMAAALLKNDGELENHRFHQYCVCIYVKAVSHLYQASRTTEDPLLKSELSRSRSSYIMAAMRSIKYFNILSPPDLPGIQSLLSSALLMQHLGRPNQCWLFTSYAARQIVALNFHKIKTSQIDSDIDQEIHDAVYWCYYLDRTLGSLLGRPPSLPDLEVSPAELPLVNPSSPYNELLRVILDLAEVQGKLQAVYCGHLRQSKEKIVEVCQLLESRMQDIFPSLQSNQNCELQIVKYDWVAVDFCYYAILVEIYRTHLQNAFNPASHRACLIYARRSLRAFHLLQKHSAEMPGFDDPYPSFLTWTLFIYPLSAFFVVFCNIIGTLDKDDYELMGQIIKELLPFKQDPHLGKLLDLLQSLQQLCEPLFLEMTGDSNIASPRGNIHDDFVPIGDSHTNSFTVGPFPPMVPFGDHLEPVSDQNADFSADRLMWDLFNSQVPAGWLNRRPDSFGPE